MPSDPVLQDTLVLDLSRVLTGPYAAMMLGDLGARVIKVERPGSGDDTRSWGPPFAGTGEHRTSTYFLSVNRNKESIALDLRHEQDLDALRKLIKRADVLVENFRPGVMDRLGLSTEELHELNDQLVVLSITGFGHDGPQAERAGYDQIVQGEAGLMSLNGPGEDQPTRIGVPICDILAGMFGAYGVLGALHRRNRTGRGDVVRTSLFAASIGVHAFQATRWLMAGEVPGPIGNHHPTLVPYQTFRCQDGLIQIAVGNDAIWKRCAAVLGIDGDAPDYRTNTDRVRNADTLLPMIEDTLQKAPLQYWLKLFGDNGVPAGEVKDLEQVYSDPMTLSQGLLMELEHSELGPVRMAGTPLRFEAGEFEEHQAPPSLDEHGPQIRRWLYQE
ncbi:MAG: CoA transferase [Pseudonocardiaceae bacterium]|nr:CoA transferase [Pseudonocardiaceae bacterium]